MMLPVTDRRAKVVVVASPKGGCSKTTVAAGLIGAALDQGYAVEVIDTDIGQHSLGDWLSSHAQVAVSISGPETVALRAASSEADLVVVDTAGADTPMIGAALVVADFVLIPTTDSLLDIRPAVRLRGRLRRQGKCARIVMSCVDRLDSLRVERARSMVVATSCLEVAIPRRVAVKDAVAARQLLSEVPSGAAIHVRFLAMLDEILLILKQEERDRAVMNSKSEISGASSCIR